MSPEQHLVAWKVVLTTNACYRVHTRSLSPILRGKVADASCLKSALASHKTRESFLIWPRASPIQEQSCRKIQIRLLNRSAIAGEQRSFAGWVGKDVREKKDSRETRGARERVRRRRRSEERERPEYVSRFLDKDGSSFCGARHASAPDTRNVKSRGRGGGVCRRGRGGRQRKCRPSRIFRPSNGSIRNVSSIEFKKTHALV
jgi:hypothetical protein